MTSKTAIEGMVGMAARVKLVGLLFINGGYVFLSGMYGGPVTIPDTGC